MSGIQLCAMTTRARSERPLPALSERQSKALQHIGELRGLTDRCQFYPTYKG